ARPVGYLLSHEVNNAFTAVYALASHGTDVYWLTSPFSADGVTYPEGTFWIPDGSQARGRIAALGGELGVHFIGASVAPEGTALELRKPRIGLWDRYGGSMPSGWVRFILDEFHMEFDLVFPQELDAGNLSEKYDVLIFPDGAIPSPRPAAPGRYGRGGGSVDPETIPEEYRDRLGSVTAETTIPQLREFLEDGGTVITLEGSTALGYHLGLPIRDYLTDAEGTPLRSEEFFVPGSLLEVEVESGSLVTHGLQEPLIVNFARSPVFRLEAEAEGVRPLAVYDSATPLRSGWAWGQEKLEGGIAMLEADVGEGTLFLFGPQVTYRGQTHATFPLVFNGILLSNSRETTLR
ncbi:MAG: peptidase, partial [Gemmatimonadetes bacterium]|nr:peptidase [Gemmatimonadota bacterium]